MVGHGRQAVDLTHGEVNFRFEVQRTARLKDVAVAIAKFDHVSRQRRRDPIVIQEIGLRHRPLRARSGIVDQRDVHSVHGHNRVVLSSKIIPNSDVNQIHLTGVGHAEAPLGAEDIGGRVQQNNAVQDHFVRLCAWQWCWIVRRVAVWRVAISFLVHKTVVVGRVADLRFKAAVVINVGIGDDRRDVLELATQGWIQLSHNRGLEHQRFADTQNARTTQERTEVWNAGVTIVQVIRGPLTRQWHVEDNLTLIDDRNHLIGRVQQVLAELEVAQRHTTNVGDRMLDSHRNGVDDLDTINDSRLHGADQIFRKRYARYAGRIVHRIGIRIIRRVRGAVEVVIVVRIICHVNRNTRRELTHWVHGCRNVRNVRDWARDTVVVDVWRFVR